MQKYIQGKRVLVILEVEFIKMISGFIVEMLNGQKICICKHDYKKV